jgi:hypothetical protein
MSDSTIASNPLRKEATCPDSACQANIHEQVKENSPGGYRRRIFLVVFPFNNVDAERSRLVVY